MKLFLIYFLIISIIGTILHFTYNLSNKNIVVGIFSAVNESVWEHIKLLLTPIFFLNTIFYVLGYQKNYFVILFLQLILSILLIIFFYSIKVKIFKKEHNYINIIIFYIASFIISLVPVIIRNLNISNKLNVISLFGSLIIFIMYLTFTVSPPKSKIFLDPNTKTYGINNL